MAERKIVSANYSQNPRFSNVTLIKLDCGHERSLGGHMFEGRVQLPSDLVGRKYDCKEGHCLGFNP